MVEFPLFAPSGESLLKAFKLCLKRGDRFGELTRNHLIRIPFHLILGIDDCVKVEIALAWKDEEHRIDISPAHTKNGLAYDDAGVLQVRVVNPVIRPIVPVPE
jgi:hypothetical protein